MVIQRSWKILSDTGSTSASSTEANKSPMGGLNSSSDDSNCSNQTTHSMVTSAASPVKIETLPANVINFAQNQNTNSHQSQQCHNEVMKFITTPQMAETALQKLRQRFSNPTPLTNSSTESAMRSLELVRIAVQAQFDKQVDEMVKHFIETYFKPAFNNIKENLGQGAVNEDALQKMSCALLENAKSQYKVLRQKTQVTTCNVITTFSNSLENNTMRVALKRPALIKSTTNIIEMQKRFLSDPQQTTQQEQNQLQLLPPVATIKAALAPKQQVDGLASKQHRQDLSLQQSVTDVESGQLPQQHNQQSHPRRQIFWNTAHISTTTKFVLDVQANQAFGFGTEGKERLASKHPELIRYLPDTEDRDWLVSQKIIPHQNRNSRFLFLIYDEVCRLYHTHDVYRSKSSVDLSIMMTFTVPDFMIQKMKLFFVDLNIKSRGLITNSYSMSSTTIQQPLQQSNSHLRNALLSGTPHTLASSTISSCNVVASSESTSSSLIGSSSNIGSTETVQQQKTKSSNLSSSHATLTALLNNSSLSSTNTPVNSTNLNEQFNNSLSNLPCSSSAPTIISKLRK